MKMRSVFDKFVNVFRKPNVEEEVVFLTLNEDSLNYYRKNVKGNKDLSEDQVRRKMTRNMKLALPYQEDNSAKQNRRVWYSYGCLRFMVQNGEVKWIKNMCPEWNGWKKDMKKYVELSEKYGIEDYQGKVA